MPSLSCPWTCRGVIHTSLSDLSPHHLGSSTSLHTPGVMASSGQCGAQVTNGQAQAIKADRAHSPPQIVWRGHCVQMEQTLKVKGQAGSEDCRLSSLEVDCQSCRCLRRRRPYPSGCIRVTRGAEHRPHVSFWRPWMQSSSRKSLPQSLPYAKGLCENRQAGQKPVDYNHPVRLFWPRTKPLNLMYLEADDLLKNFPVQATLSFYDSESDTDNDEENTEEEHDSGFESE